MRIKKSSINLFLLFCSILLSFVLLETSSRIIWKIKYNQYLKQQLHGFDHIDSKRSIIIPNPNTKITVEKYRAGLVKHGKTISLKNLETVIEKNQLIDKKIIFSINEHGFKGPEISIPKPSSVFRILCIGDSVTWGPFNDYFSYPRVMERELNILSDKKFNVEVINAGVLGENIERAIKRSTEFLAAEPDLVTIYLGWNGTIVRSDPKKNMLLYRTLSLYKIFYHFIINRADTGLEEDYDKKTYYEKDDPSIEGYYNWSFTYDISDLHKLIKIIKKKNGNTKIVIITIAGLFDYRLKPDSHSLKVAYPIASTNNLYAWPLLTRKYNDELRDFARKNSLKLIDFEDYVFRNLKKRSKYFRDSVHLNEEGYVKMGKYFASQIKNDIKRIGKKK